MNKIEPNPVPAVKYKEIEYPNDQKNGPKQFKTLGDI